MKGSLFGLTFILVGLLSTGCARTVTLCKVQPAPFDVSGYRLGVVNNRSLRAESQGAYDVMMTKLANSGVYLVDQQGLQRAVSSPLFFNNGKANGSVAVRAARQLELDRLLVTTIRFVELDGTVYGEKAWRFGDPKVTAAVQYELVDVRSGTVLNRNTVQAEYYTGEMEFGEEAKILLRLAREGGLKMANVLTPHETTIEVPLAQASFGFDSTEMRDGCEAAQDGDWVMARQHWNAVLRSDPQNVAALYNLGLAHEALGDLYRARQFIKSACAIDANDMHLQALQRLQQSETALRLARVQKFTEARASHPPRVPRNHNTALPTNRLPAPGINRIAQ